MACVGFYCISISSFSDELKNANIRLNVSLRILDFIVRMYSIQIESGCFIIEPLIRSIISAGRKLYDIYCRPFYYAYTSVFILFYYTKKIDALTSFSGEKKFIDFILSDNLLVYNKNRKTVGPFAPLKKAVRVRGIRNIWII